ncbi:MAG: hypothetical protein ABIC04_04895 [Nanoarchaeota archaeon]
MSKKGGLKNWKILLMFAILFFVSLFIVHAYPYTITYSCPEDYCVIGQDINWSILIENKGVSNQKIVSLELIDSINESVISSVNYEYDPYDANKMNYLVISPNKEKTVSMSVKAPKPNWKKNLVYRPCITTALLPTDARYMDSHTIRHCYPNNESIRIYDCLDNNHCEIDEACNNNICKKIKCDYCQYPLKHVCADYECCESEKCEWNERCVDNKCFLLNCSIDEGIQNNSCVSLNCSEDEYIVKHKCEKLNCSFDEKLVNHSCASLFCDPDEFIANHSCIKYNCLENEYIHNGSCQKLKCLYNETTFNHTCVLLECGLFHKKTYQRCAVDNQFIFKFSIELVIIVVIIFLFMLDYKKFESKKEEFKNTGKKQKKINETDTEIDKK